MRTDSDQQAWLASYNQALQIKDGEPTTSCQIFSQLSIQEKFILKDLALLRAHLICKDRRSLLPVVDNFVEKYPYLQALNIERMMKEAEAASNNTDLAKALRLKAMASDRVREKQVLLQQAISLASGDSELRQELQVRLFQIAPRLKQHPTLNDYYKVGADFISNREFSKGRSYLRKIFRSGKTSWEEKIQARKLYRNSFKIEQDRERYLVESEKLTLWLLRQPSKDWKLIHENYLAWARGAWTLGNVPLATQIFQRAEKQLAGHWPLDEIHYIRGRMRDEAGDHTQALKLFEQSIDEAKDGSITREKAMFAKAWLLRKMGKYTEAVVALQGLKDKTTDPFDQNRYSFWLARTLQQAGQAVESKREYDRLKVEDSLGYYGLLAYKELGEEMPPVPISNLADLDWGSLDSETRRMIYSLSRVKETEVLEKYLNLKTSTFSKIPSNMSALKYSETWLTYLKAYAAAGLYLPLFTQLGLLENNVKTQLLKENPELLFPRKYIEVIGPWADKFNVRPELILAIIRQESAFNPFARSPADAFGLMQLLPGIAKEQAGKTGIVLKHYEDLFDPLVNIPTGAAFLGQLQKKYRGQYVLIAAAYNANEKAIRGWLQTRLKEDPLEFIEDIPYEETRSYVKLVLRNFVFYSRLRDPTKPLRFPTWCLEDLQSFKVSTK